MSDWIEHIGQVVVDVTCELCRNRTRAQVIGIIFAAFAACVLVGAMIAWATGMNLGTVEWCVIASLVLLFTCSSIYCFLSEG